MSFSLSSDKNDLSHISQLLSLQQASSLQKNFSNRMVWVGQQNIRVYVYSHWKLF